MDPSRAFSCVEYSLACLSSLASLVMGIVCTVQRLRVSPNTRICDFSPCRTSDLLARAAHSCKPLWFLQPGEGLLTGFSPKRAAEARLQTSLSTTRMTTRSPRYLRRRRMGMAHLTDVPRNDRFSNAQNGIDEFGGIRKPCL